MLLTSTSYVISASCLPLDLFCMHSTSPTIDELICNLWSLTPPYGRERGFNIYWPATQYLVMPLGDTFDTSRDPSDSSPNNQHSHNSRTPCPSTTVTPSKAFIRRFSAHQGNYPHVSFWRMTSGAIITCLSLMSLDDILGESSTRPEWWSQTVSIPTSSLDRISLFSSFQTVYQPALHV